MKTGAFFLDMDGVVLDSMAFHVAAWMKALSDMGFRVREEMLYLYEGAIEPDIAVDLFSTEGCLMNQEKFHAVLRRQKEIFVSDFRKRVKPFPEIPEILYIMKRGGVKLALVTSSHRDILEAVMPPELMRFFDRVITGDNVKRRKPHPDPYLAAMRALNMLSDKRAAAVENAPSGIKSANAAGLRTIAITTTLPASRLEGADTIISHHSQLLDEL